jgi:hypothetical protein
MNFKNYLVTVTRAQNTLRIYTDDKVKLKERLIENKGNKISSLELIEMNKSKEKAIKTSSSNHNNLQNSSPIRHAPSKTTQIKNPLRYDKYVIENIKKGLNQDAESIAIELLGKPKLKGNNFLKFGSNQGSLSVTIKGEREGWWNDFSEAGGRNMLSFIQKYAGLSKREALEFGAKRLGIMVDNKGNFGVETKIRKETLDSVAIESSTESLKKRVAFAKSLASQSVPIKGTLAEKYLNKHRSIILESYPEDIRFHQGIYSKINGKTLPAMLVIARNAKGDIQAVQATYLDKKTENKVNESNIPVPKQTFGSLKGAALTIKGFRDAPTLIAEGTETGLSLAQALSNKNIKITLGISNFKNIDIKSLSSKVIFCLDNDGKEIKQNHLIIDSINRILEAKNNVLIMIPESLEGGKKDFNDVLKVEGTEGIKREYHKAFAAHELLPNSKNVKQIDVSAKENIQMALNNQANRTVNFAKINVVLTKTDIKISDNTIALLAKEMSNSQEINRSTLDSARQLLSGNEVIKTSQKIDFEQEI